MSVRRLGNFISLRVLPHYEVELTDDWRTFRLTAQEWLRLEEVLNDLRQNLPPVDRAALLQSMPHTDTPGSADPAPTADKTSSGG